MLRCVFLIIFCTFVNIAHAQSNAPILKDFLGKWEGTLNIYKQQNIVQSLPMRFQCQPTDTAHVYTWYITYGKDTIQGLRPYSIREKDGVNGQFIIDEHNGILLDAFLMDDRLISRFEVGDSQLTASYQVNGDTMIFEIIVNGKIPMAITGKNDDAQIPEVLSYKISGFQRAVLKRQ